jgi:hypothetical protein
MFDRDYEFDAMKSPVIGHLLLVIFLVVVIIFLLNMLVAIMTETFERVQGNSQAHWRLELCKTLLEELYVNPKTRNEDNRDDFSSSDVQSMARYVHILKRAEHKASIAKDSGSSEDEMRKLMEIIIGCE